jgi:hypothetical protein
MRTGWQSILSKVLVYNKLLYSCINSLGPVDGSAVLQLFWSPNEVKTIARAIITTKRRGVQHGDKCTD